MNILIAEDNLFTSKQYKMVLEKNGHTVSVTKDGVECIDEYINEAQYSELFRKDKSPPYDLVLLDHDMPRKNGAEVAKEIFECRPNQRIIFLSAYGQGILEKTGDLKDDTVQIIQKSFSLGFLLQKVEGRLISSRILGTPTTGETLTMSQERAALR